MFRISSYENEVALNRSENISLLQEMSQINSVSQHSAGSTLSSPPLQVEISSWDYDHYSFASLLHYRTKPEQLLRVSDLTRKSAKIQSQKYLRFLHILVAIAVIYAVPAVQLIYGYLDLFQQGEQVYLLA